MNEEMQDESKIVANNGFSCKKQTPPPDGGGACEWFCSVVCFVCGERPVSKFYARAPEKIQKGAEEIKRAHRSSLHSVPLAIRLISKPTPRTFQVHTKQNQRIISCFPAWDRMREDWKQKRKQAPEPDGGGACVWILNLSLCSSVNALYQNFALSAGGSGWCASQGRRAPGRGSTPRQWQCWWQPEYCAHRRCAAGSSRWAPRA